MLPRRANNALAMAAVLASLSAFAPALGRTQARPVPNMPGERLLPPPPSRPRRLGPDDLSKLQAASDKRARRNWRNNYRLAHGGWISTQTWLNRLARIEAAKLQHQ